MRKVLIAEWLPRGGITQTSETWRRVGREHGLDVRIVGRIDGHFVPDDGADRRFPSKAGAVEVHRRVVRSAIDALDAWGPDVLYVQNYWIPALERRVVEEANRRGIRTVLALHNAVPHSVLAGSRIGLPRLLRASDEIVVHSNHVGEVVSARHGRSTTLVGHPLPLELLEAEPIEIPEVVNTPLPLAVSFGVMRRRYKGADVVVAAAPAVVDAWQVVIAGAGAAAPAGSPAITVDRFLPPGQLRWLLEHATVSLLPYRRASQSGAVVLAQALGAPPISSAVGGIPEQVEHGRTGWLLPVGSPPSAWADLLRSLHGAHLRDVASGARDRVQRSHERAVEAWRSVVDG